MGRANISYEPGSKLLVLGMVIQPLIGNPYNGYINTYYWVDDHPLLYGNNGSLDPSTYVDLMGIKTKHTNPPPVTSDVLLVFLHRAVKGDKPPVCRHWNGR